MCRCGYKDLPIRRLEEGVPGIDTREECMAITTRQNDTPIVIKKVDKGSAVIACNRQDYLKEAENELSGDKV